MSRSQATRARVLRAAHDLLAEGDPATMGAIARRAGVTRQLLYLHFDGRGDLLLELSRSIDAELRGPELQGRIDEAPDARAALAASVAVQGELKPTLEPIVRAMERLAGEDAEVAAALAEREEARLRRCRDVVDRLGVEGALDQGRDPAEAADILWALTSQRAWRDLVAHRGWSTGRWVEHTVDLAARALCGLPFGSA